MAQQAFASRAGNQGAAAEARAEPQIIHQAFDSVLPGDLTKKAR
jgi:hypothetical protein